MARDRAVLSWMLVMLALSTLAVWSGQSEVAQQRSNIQSLLQSDQEDRSAEALKLHDWGSAAYYNFHLTYDEPSDFAFAAMGKRDLLPWKHRIRMLALEGQIYERDAGNPIVALIGRFDFAFLAAFILPLALIMLLYDLRAGERSSKRHDLLETLAPRPASFWLLRGALRAMVLFSCLVIPILIVGITSAASFSTVLMAVALVLAYALFWLRLCNWFASWNVSGSVILVSLIGAWLALAVVIPAGARLAIDRMISIPEGADILMTQRETVNDAWDLPVATTMDAFVERHPEWRNYTSMDSSFEWKWYYAFQQVGDQETEALTKAYLEGRLKRDRLAAIASFLAPPSLLERSLQSLAKTDLQAAIKYENQVRAFHAELREFYYPRLFRDTDFDQSMLKQLPVFDPEGMNLQK